MKLSRTPNPQSAVGYDGQRLIVRTTFKVAELSNRTLEMLSELNPDMPLVLPARGFARPVRGGAERLGAHYAQTVADHEAAIERALVFIEEHGEVWLERISALPPMQQRAMIDSLAAKP